MYKEKEYNHNAASKKLKELVDDVRICMLATKNHKGLIASRPMTTISVEENGTIWFFTNEHSGKVDDQQEDNTVYLMYSDSDKQKYIHIRGASELILDRQKIKQYWNPILKAWFPEGLDDPKLCLLKIDVEEAQYWDSSSSKMIVFFEMVKSIVTRKPFSEGETGTLNISSEERSIH